MFSDDKLAPSAVAGAPPEAMLDEIHNHLVFVLTEKLGWHDAVNPEMSVGSGHVVIRFEVVGQRYVFRVAKHGLQQHKRTMLAYRHVGGLGIIPEKIYHDGKCVIERHADGVALTAQVSDGVLVQLAQRLSQLHAMAAQGFGPLDFDLQACFADAAAYYQAQPQITLDRSEMDLTDAQESLLQDALQQVQSLRCLHFIFPEWGVENNLIPLAVTLPLH